MKKLLSLAGLLMLANPSFGDIAITQGSGTNIATDAPGSVNYQKIKICDGGSGSTVCISTFPVQGSVAINTAPAGNPNYVVGVGPTGLTQAFRVDASSNIYDVPQVSVSSATTMPTAQPDKSSTTAMGDPYGRLVVMQGVPTSIQLSTTTDAVANTKYVVLVASPSSTVFTHLCGCIITNSATTGASVDIVASGNKANGTARDYRTIFAAPADTRGIWPGCGSPFLNSIAGGVQISALSSSASASLTISCQYFQNFTP